MSTNLVRPGVFELYSGPMCSEKTKSLIDRVHKIDFLDDVSYLFIKPECDVRDYDEQGDPCISSRNISNTYKCAVVNEAHPSDILTLVQKIETSQSQPFSIIAFDEIEFFHQGIYNVVTELMKDGKNVIASGLYYDFRGEVFGEMGKLAGIATPHVTLTSICEYPECNSDAMMAQRLINGQPANYNDPIVMIEEKGNITETYEPRCFEHHIVPGRPN